MVTDKNEVVKTVAVLAKRLRLVQGFLILTLHVSFVAVRKFSKYIPASTVRRVEDFIIENRKVEGQSKTNRVRWREFDHGNVACSFVSYQTVLSCLLSVIACGELCQVPVVISLPEQGKHKGQTDQLSS